MIKLYGYKGRSRAERVLWALQELDIAFEMIRLDFKKGENKSEEFLRINPSGKVPVLIHDNKTYTESIAIIHYLNSISIKSIIPEDPIARYEYDNKLFFLITEIEPYLWIADQNLFLFDKYKWPEGTANCCKLAFDRGISELHKWLENSEYIANGKFSAVDIVAYHLLTWATLYGQIESVKISTYLSRLEARPHFPFSMKAAGSPINTG